MISWRMAAAWVAAVVAATVLTWQIVGLADSQVGESPVAVAPVLPTTSPEVTISSAPTTSSDLTPTSSTSTTTSPATTSTAATGSTSSSASSSSTAATTEWSVRTVNSPGGSVVIRHRPGEVELQAATPAPGFGVEIDDDGPDRVRVEFEGDAVDFRVEARWNDGMLVVEVDD